MKAASRGMILPATGCATAQAYYLGADRKRTMTETVATWQDYGPDIIPTPHPSWRTAIWAKKNPWFEADLVPVLRSRVQALLESR